MHDKLGNLANHEGSGMALQDCDSAGTGGGDSDRRGLCGGRERKVAGSMPAGQSWAGVYYNPVYGYLHLIEKDGSLVGRWRRTDGSHWGELSGTADGNLMHFTWKEHTIGAVGPSGEARGSGVFSYKLPSNSDIAELDGQYALDDSSDIGQWHCVKQNNIPPDIDSVKGDNPDAPVGGHDKWQ